jgi:hypothetical protein
MACRAVPHVVCEVERLEEGGVRLAGTAARRRGDHAPRPSRCFSGALLQEAHLARSERLLYAVLNVSV